MPLQGSRMQHDIAQHPDSWGAVHSSSITAHRCALYKMLCAAQLPLLKARWRSILLGAVFQYVHAMSTQLAHRMHRPMMEPLHDIGFDLLPVRAAQMRML